MLSDTNVERPGPLVDIQHVTKSFGTVRILNDVSMTVNEGQVVAIIGPSGSGKTTLLRCIDFLEEFEQGSIQIAGEYVGYQRNSRGIRRRRPESEIAAQRSNVGMVFQSFNLFPHLTIRQNLVVAPIRVRKIPPAEAEERAEELLEKIGLLEKADAYPAMLSGGQQQRVALARALAMRPRVMLFDEVTSALDPELVGEVLASIKSLAAEGMTMILVTHEMQFARDVAHTIVFMADGAIVESGAPAEIFGNPRSERLHAFLRRYRDAYLI